MKDIQTIASDPSQKHLLGFLSGERDSMDWLEKHRPGLSCFLRSLEGGPKARQKLASLEPSHWEEVFEIIACEELESRLLSDHEFVHRLFSAAKGNEEAFAILRRHKPSYALLAEMIREASDKAMTTSGTVEEGQLNGPTAADVGCLIGEMHLGRGEYQKAVEAFTRAIENNPTADAHEGRARAYQLLASVDERLAAKLRGH